ncbi:MAG: PAS domain S-box protein, partial [Anaerolineae bacterium]
MSTKNKLYQGIVESAHGPVLIIEAGQVVDVNDSVLGILGLSKKALMGRPWLSLLTPEQPDGQTVETSFQQKIDRVKEQGQAAFNWQIQSADDQIVQIAGMLYRLDVGGTEAIQISLSTHDLYIPVTQANYQLIFDAIPDSVVIYDLDGNVAYLNPAFEQTFGWTMKELLGKRIDFVPEENQAETMEAISRLLKGEKTSLLYSRRLTKDGRILDVNISASLFDDENGRPAGSIILIRDETQYRQTQAALESSEARRLDLLETIEDGYYEIDLAGNMTFCNSALSHMMGYTPAEFLGMHYREYVDKETASEITQTFNQVFNSREPFPDYEYQAYDKNGEQHTVQISINLMFDDDATPVGFGGIVRDVTERIQIEQKLRQYQVELENQVEERTSKLAKANTQLQEEIAEREQTEIALRESESQTRQIVDNALDAVISMDADSRILEWNQQAEATWGWSREDVIGQDLTEIVMPERFRQGHQEGLKKFLATNEGPILNKRIEITALHREGHEFPIELSVTAVPTGDTYIFNAFLRDISERKQAEQELQKTVESQQVINTLLQIAQEPISLDEQLERALDTILSPNWIATLPIGCIFLVEDDPDVLVLKAERQLGKPLLKECALIKFGQCLCGRAAERGEMLFSDCVGEEHEISYQGMQPHGHYNIPIMVDDEVGGVLNLYVKEGHQPDEAEQDFLEAVTNTLATMIKRNRIEQSVQDSLSRRERQVGISTQIAQEIAAAADLDELYQQVVNLVKEEFGFYHVQLLRYDPALNSVALTYGYGDVGREMLDLHHSMPLGVGLIGKAVESKKSILYSDVTKAADWQPNALLTETRSELAIPIQLKDEVLGVLDVQSSEVDGLKPDDQLVLEGLCGQIAVAIESTRLRQDMEAQLRELNQLQRSLSREGWEAYQKAQVQVSGYAFDHSGLRQLSAADVPMAGMTAVSPEKNGSDPDAAQEIQPIAAPLAVRGEKIGALLVEDDPERPLTPEEREVLNAVSQQLAEALDSARLFEQTQLSLAEQERLSGELETVAKVSTAASTILEVDALLQSVVDLAKTSFGLYHAHIYLRNEMTGKLALRAGADSVGRLMVLEGREINQEAESLVARSARSRQGIIENDVRKTIDFLPHPLLPNTQAELAMPMIVGDKLLGVLDLQSEQVGFFREEEMDVYRTLASQVGVAVQNATLFSEQVATADKLREVDRLKSEFLASMSHELRTPLNSIIGFADVLLEGLDGDLNGRMEEDVRLIRNSGSHLRELIGEILDMSKIEAGRMELRYERIDMRQMAQDIIATAKPLAQEKELGLFLELADDVEIVEADRTRIRQVMWNILGNAIKFTERGHVKLTVDIDDDEMARIGIHDTGIGIKPEDVHIVFEQFRQVDGKLNRKAGGTGLGMPITKKLIEIHGGDIWVESEMGTGSTFWFTLPLTEQAARIRKGTT